MDRLLQLKTVCIMYRVSSVFIPSVVVFYQNFEDDSLGGRTKYSS